jgi:hypothetical protein
MCNSNYKSSGGEFVSVYKFPQNDEERKKWISAIPRQNLVVSKYTAVCRKHWPEDACFTSVHGKLRPTKPPSIFENVPPSCLSSPPAKCRKTAHASASKRNILPDEFSSFQEQDLLLIDQISSKLSADTDLIVYKDNLNTTIQSKVLNCAVPNFIIKLSNDFNYVALSQWVNM